MFALLFCLLAVPTRALAHVPHDTVVSWAPDLGGSRPWYVLLDAHAPILLESADAGASFDSIGGAPMGDRPVDLARLDDGTVVLLGSTEVWWSADGRTWESEPLPAELTHAVADQDEILLAGPGGIWRMVPGASPEQESDQPVATFDGGSRPAAILASGELLVGVDGAWTVVAAPESPARSVFGASTVLWAGTEDGRLLAWDGATWSACGTLPSTGIEHGDVVAIAVDETAGSIAVSDGFSIVSVSDDACLSWTDRELPDATIYDVDGAAEDEREAAIGLALSGDDVALAGWPGIYVGDPAGSWEAPALMVVDYVRGLALSAERNGFPMVLVGPQGAGPIYTEDGGQSWAAPGHGLPAENVQQVAVDRYSRKRAYAVVNHIGYQSSDGGQSWNKVDASGGKVSVFRVGATACDVWAGAQGAVIHSPDCGEHWTKVALPDEMPTTFDDFSRVAVDGSDAWCLLTREPAELWCGEADIGPFDQRWVGGETDVPAMGVWPAGKPSTILVGSGSGVWRSTDAFGTSTQVLSLALDEVAALEVADDGTVFVATLAGALWRSDDGGETWVDTGLRATAPIWTMDARQGMANTADLILGTLDGLFLVDDPLGDALTAERFSPWARVDDTSGYWQGLECTSVSREATAGLDTLSSFPEPCTISLRARGADLTVYGTSDGLSTVEFSVDGVVLDTFGDAVNAAIAPLSSVPVDNGWHTIVLSASDAAGVQLDGIELVSAGAMLRSSGDTAGVEEIDTGGPDDSGGDTGTPDETGDTPDDSGDGDTASGTEPGDCDCATVDPRMLLVWIGALPLLYARRK